MKSWIFALFNLKNQEYKKNYKNQNLKGAKKEKEK